MSEETPESKSKEQREKEVLTEYVTNRLKSLLKVDKDIFLAAVTEVAFPILFAEQGGSSNEGTSKFNENRRDFQMLYEEAQLYYLSELDEGKRHGNLENALKRAEKALKGMGSQNLITMEEGV